MSELTARAHVPRRAFLQAAVAAAILPGVGRSQTPPASSRPVQPFDAHEPLTIERPVSGKPRAGQVVAAIQPDSDDIPLFAAGTLFKLIDEGATITRVR
jgi:hypothetical protein